MKTLFIRPLDTQFHRDGRPFDAGSESEALCVFPPYPRVLYGCLRTAIMSHHPSYTWGTSLTDPSLRDLYAVVGDPSGFGSLRLRGPWVAQALPGTSDITPWYQAPLDLVEVKNCRGIYRFITPQETESPLSQRTNLREGTLYACRQRGNPDEFLETLDGSYLDGTSLEFYLTGRAPQPTWVENAENLHRVEARIGLGRDTARKTARAGLLYAARHVRLRDDRSSEGGFMAEVEEDRGLLQPSGILRLGGDSRPAEYREIRCQDWSQIKTSVQQYLLKTGRFKMVLVTPAIFNSWYPDCLTPDGTMLTGTLPGCAQRVVLVGACVGRALPIGGFDLVKGHPKPIQKAVPAGSVYFLKFHDWDSLNDERKRQAVEELLTKWFHRSLCGDPYGKEGFGVVIIGGWGNV